MMWHQLQLMAAMRQSSLLLDAAGRPSGSGEAPSSSATTALSASSRQANNKRLREDADESITLGSWSAPALPSSTTDLDDDALAFRSKTQDVMQQCFDAQLAKSTEKSYEDILKLEVGAATKALNAELLPLVDIKQFTALSALSWSTTTWICVGPENAPSRRHLCTGTSADTQHACSTIGRRTCSLSGVVLPRHASTSHRSRKPLSSTPWWTIWKRP